MKNHFSDLIEIMQKEAQLYLELKTVQENKKNIIINNDVKALDAITKKEQGFVKTIVQLETLRTQAVDGLCREKGTGRIETIKELYDLLNIFEQQQLKVFELKLVNAVEEIQQLNFINGKLIEQSLEYIDMTLTLAQSLGMEDAGYGRDAEGREVKTKKSLFDVKV